MTERIVVIGAGPVGIRFAEELLPAVEAGRVSVTVVGAEATEPYNRVLVAEYAAGEMDADGLVIATADELRRAGIDLRLAARAVRIDRAAAAVVLDDGGLLGYDRLVLATGARSVVPRLDGLDELGVDASGLDARLTTGVCVLRSLEDAAHVRSVVDAGGRVVVLGAGVLGIELAMLLAEAGATATVAHFGPIPMPRQLDRGSAWVLGAALASAGVTVVPHTRAEAVIAREDEDGVRRFRALVSADARQIEGDLLVLSCGTRARTELAEEAGLRVGRGVLVDAQLRSWSDPRIHAIGDCAHVADPSLHLHEREVPGGPNGLIAPGWRQAESLAAAIIAELDGVTPQPLAEEQPGVVALKADRVDLVSAGDVSAEPFAPVPAGEEAPGIAVWSDPQHGSYVKMATRDGILTGFVCVGLPRTGAELGVLYLRRGELPADRSLLLRLDSADEPEARASGREATVCICNAVTVGTVEDAIADGCATVAEVGGCTRAGTGCGGCRARITELINAAAGVPA
ncbi:FAD-dependent oxidoreductase [Pseudoclavibacter helvolus]|uniref:FAD-dependent oxidoreductase n=1 Tax=Pseudoclavibacter helvolus TaxID=255205 RepID=UPI003C76A00A